ncbi:hypothetical protein N9924_00775 [bacterium]|nr:hypothetical protein [bacterium]
MFKKTLLEIVQDILNDMDSDEVNSIDDTFESQQVAQIVSSTFQAMISNRNWPHLRKLVQVAPSGDSSLPTHMTVQDNIKEMLFLNYNTVKLGETRKRYKRMKWVEPDDFLRISNQRNNDSANVDVIVDPTGVELLVLNDREPTHYTSFDDETLVFDAYDSAVDSTLQQVKVQAQAYVTPSFVLTDSHIPDLPEEAFTALIEEAKAKAFFKLKQMQDVKAEQEAGRQQRWLSRKAWRVNGGIIYPNYGRATRKTRNSVFDKDNVKPTG